MGVKKDRYHKGYMRGVAMLAGTLGFSPGFDQPILVRSALESNGLRFRDFKGCDIDPEEMGRLRRIFKA